MVKEVHGLFLFDCIDLPLMKNESACNNVESCGSENILSLSSLTSHVISNHYFVQGTDTTIPLADVLKSF